VPHIHERIDFTVEVFVHDGEVLLRWHDKYGKWLSVGGHVELDEDPNQAAYREVQEETGLEINLLDDLKPRFSPRDGYEELIPPVFLNRNRINEHHEHITLTYFATSESKVINPDEGEKKTDYLWLSRKEIEEMIGIDEEIRFYALTALEAVRRRSIA